MDPHILTIGKTLEEARTLRREHMELIEKMQVISARPYPHTRWLCHVQLRWIPKTRYTYF